MDRSRPVRFLGPTRRDVLKRVGAGAVAALLAEEAARQPALAQESPSNEKTKSPSGPPSNRHTISGIDPKNIVDEYERRELDAVSDAELCRQAAAIISKPPTKGGSSFTLHAPLEL